MYCSKCGAKARDGAAFCEKCGAPLVQENHSENKTEKASGTEHVHETVDAENKSLTKKNGKSAVRYLLPILLIGALVLLLVRWMKPDALPQEDESLVAKQSDASPQEEIPATKEPNVSSQGGIFASVTGGHIEDAYYIGDTVSMSQTDSSGIKGYYNITMTDWGTYKPEYSNDVYVYAVFEVENTGNEEISIAQYSFSAYVNNYKVDVGQVAGDDGLSATLSSGRRTNGKVYIQMDPGDISQLELELGDIIFRIQDNRFTEEIPFGYEGEENYTDYMEWGGDYDGGWMDTTLTFSLYSDGSQDPGCGYMTTHFRGMESTGKLYYLGGNQFRWESGGYDSAWPETYYVYAVYNNSEYQLELYNSDGEYEVTFTLYEQYIP